MPYTLGIDAGTTHTAAAILVNGRAEVLRLGSRRAEVPSLVFVPADGPVLIGEPAERRGQAEPGRLAREVKRRVGDPVPILVGGAPFSAHALIARQLEHVLRTAVAHQGGPPAHVVLTCPANWGPYKRELLEQAARLADLPPVSLRTEPEAAAIEYAAGERMGVGDVIAVYDLGGGTFDAAVLRRTATGFDILGAPEGIEQLGGMDFDEAVFEHVVQALPPEHLAEPDVAALTRLRRDCVEAKEALSEDTEVLIPVALPQLHTRVRLTRAEFEAMVRPALTETVGAMRRALRSAGVRAEDLRTILLSGGSSRIPLVAQLLSTEFDRPVVLDPHPEHSIALGAARVSAPPAYPRASGSGARSTAAPAPPPPRPVPAPPAPVSPAPAPAAPISAPPVPVSSAPVSSAPVSSAPVSSAPVSSAPVSSAPAEVEQTQTVPYLGGQHQPPVMPGAAGRSPQPGGGDPTATAPLPVATAFAHGTAPVRTPEVFEPDRIAGPRRTLGRRAQIALAAVAVLAIAGVATYFVAQRDPDGSVAAGPPSPSAVASAAPVVSAAGPVDCGENETFDAETIDPSWERTRPDAALALGGSAAKLTAPEGSDIYDNRVDAPMLLRTVPGDFVMETTVAARPSQFYQGAGLVLWIDETRYVRLELGYGDLRAVVFEYRDGGKHTKVHPPERNDPDVVPTQSDNVVLQLTRAGQKVTARWHAENEKTLRDLGSITVDLPDTVQAGISVLNRAQSGAKPKSFQATFYRVWFTC